MDDFARDLFEFGLSLSRAQLHHDSRIPSERVVLVCGSCDGSGFFGCTKDCVPPDPATTTDAEYDLWQENERFHLKHHKCWPCKGTGRIE